jgi:hypothetical protein
LLLLLSLLLSHLKSGLIVLPVDFKIFVHICDDCRVFREGEWEKNNIDSSGLFGRLISSNFSFDRNKLIEPNNVNISNLIVKFWEVKDDGKAVDEHQLFSFGQSAPVSHRFIGFGPIVLTNENAAATEISPPHKIVACGVATTITRATKIADAAIIYAASSLHVGLIVREKMMCSWLACTRNGLIGIVGLVGINSLSGLSASLVSLVSLALPALAASAASALSTSLASALLDATNLLALVFSMAHQLWRIVG